MRVHTVLFDLAGTTVDCGCFATVRAFVDTFSAFGVVLDEPTARGPMGVSKREHVRRLLAEPQIHVAWEVRYGHAPTEADVDELHAACSRRLLELLPDHASPIPGALAGISGLRAQGVRVGATTAYSTPMLRVLLPAMESHGWTPTVVVSADEVPEGRPAPYLNQVAAMRLGAPDVLGCVVVGDTAVDMQAARNAGMWAVGVALTGNEVGLGVAGLRALSAPERAHLRARAKAGLEAGGAHVVVDDVGALEAALRVLRRPTLAAVRRWAKERSA